MSELGVGGLADRLLGLLRNPPWKLGLDPDDLEDGAVAGTIGVLPVGAEVASS
jgi:hypothetical protein